MRARLFIVCLVLALLTCSSFGAVVGHEFVDWDDPEYVVDNAHVRGGLSWDGFAWAFSTGTAANYHPLTWLSHMLDVELHGLAPAGHHLTSLALHTANVVLLLIFLNAATGRLWPSAFAAGLFAVHPLHVESVAWVSERKDVLSGFFAMLTLLQYVRTARRPGPWRQAALLLTFCLGLLAKSMLVTLPLVLLLLDFWPLGRLAQAGRRGALLRCVVEKTPLVALAVLFGGVTLFVQIRGGAVTGLAVAPLTERLSNSTVAYVLYVAKTLFPVDLSYLYVYPMQPRPPWETFGAAALLALGSALTLALRRRHPCLLAGWLWFLIVLLPVIGLVQVGVHFMADRYTYLPLIGFFLAAAWGGADGARAIGRRSAAAGGVAAVLVLASLTLLTRNQVRFWKDDIALFGHATDVDPDNWLAHNNLGRAFARKGLVSDAALHFETALRINPRSAEAWYNLGLSRHKQGRLEEAVQFYRTALSLKPDYPDAHNNLGASLLQLGRARDAIAHFEAAARLSPLDPTPLRNLGSSWDSLGDLDKAENYYRLALRLRPDYVAADVGLRQVLRRRGLRH